MPDVAQRERAAPVDQPHRYAYQPALDGIRALAVTAVVLFHCEVGAFGGGFLGVDVFLVLSGYLITTLLVREFVGAGRIAVGAFYGRRARRLLPALFLVLGAIVVYGRLVADQLQLVKLRADVMASLFYVANWRFIFSGAGYFEQFASPSPVSHLWSLAIEEQWYLVWPLVVVGLMSLIGPPIGSKRRVWLAVTLGLAAVSAALMAFLVNDSDVNRVYYGTDTRAQALLIGAALAVWLHARPLSRRAQRLLDRIGLGGLATCVALFVLVGASDRWMYRGGFLLAAISAGAVIAGAAGPKRGWTRDLLSVSPLPALGRISYGVYLWHWPVIVYLDAGRTHLDGVALFGIRICVTLLASIASYELVEQPIRHHRWPARRAAFGTAGTIAVLAALIIGVVPVAADPDQELLQAQTSNQQLALKPGESPSAQRILVEGDSVSLSLSRGFDASLLGKPSLMRSGGRLGCSLGPSYDSTCFQVLNGWKSSIGAFDPDVTVVFPGPWDLLPALLPDRDSNGNPLKVRTDAYDQWLHKRLADAFAILTARGGGVAMFNLPCYSYAVGASPKAEDINWFNGVLRDAVAKAGSRVKLIDYDGYLCPGGKDQRQINGVKMRYDGIHLTHEGAQLVWKWLAPQLPSRQRS